MVPTIPEHVRLLKRALHDKGLSPTAFALANSLDGNLLRLLARGEPPPRTKAGRLLANEDPKYHEIAELLFEPTQREAWIQALVEAQISADGLRVVPPPAPPPRRPPLEGPLAAERWLDLLQQTWFDQALATPDWTHGAIVINQLILAIGAARPELAPGLRALPRATSPNPAQAALQRLATLALSVGEGVDFAERRRVVDLILRAANADPAALDALLDRAATA